MYTITYCGDEFTTQRLKEKGMFPFIVGDIAFDEKTIHVCDDLTPFLYGNANHKAVWPWLKVEMTNNTKGDQPHEVRTSEI